MGGTVTNFYKYVAVKSIAFDVLLLGLDNSGKKTFLYATRYMSVGHTFNLDNC